MNESKHAEKNRNKIIRGPDGEIIKIDETTPDPPDPAVYCLRSRSDWPVIRLAAAESLTLGRDPNQAGIVINHQDISRRHAKLRVNAQVELQVINLDSINGAYLDHAKAGSEAWINIAAGQRLILSREEIVYELAQE